MCSYFCQLPLSISPFQSTTGITLYGQKWPYCSSMILYFHYTDFNGIVSIKYAIKNHTSSINKHFIYVVTITL